MRRNASLIESVIYRCFGENILLGLRKTARVEIISHEDLNAKRLKPFARKVAENLVEMHPTLKIYGVFRTHDPWNYTRNPFLMGLFHGYVILISSNYDLRYLKRSCMELELNEDGERIADIDIYLGPDHKLSRKDLTDKL